MIDSFLNIALIEDVLQEVFIKSLVVFQVTVFFCFLNFKLAVFINLVRCCTIMAFLFYDFKSIVCVLYFYFHIDYLHSYGAFYEYVATLFSKF